MFHFAFQNGSCVEVFDPKVNKDKDKNYANLVRIVSPSNVRKCYEKTIKGYIYEIDQGLSTRIQLPKDEKLELGLVQQYLIIQLYLYPSKAFSIELAVTDTSKTKRRIFLTSAVSKIDLNFFHVKVPIDVIQRETWLNLCIDILSFMEAFKGQTFRSLDTIIIGANCKLRKIFTMKNPIFENYFEEEQFDKAYDTQHSQEVPKNHNFPAGISYLNQILTYGMIKSYQLEKQEGAFSSNLSDYSQIQTKPAPQILKPSLNVKGTNVSNQLGVASQPQIESMSLKNPSQNNKKPHEGSHNISQAIEKKGLAQSVKVASQANKPKETKKSDGSKKKEELPKPEAYEIQGWQHEDSEQDLHILPSDEDQGEEVKYNEQAPVQKKVASNNPNINTFGGKKQELGQEPRQGPIPKNGKNPWAGSVVNKKTPVVVSNNSIVNQKERSNKKAPKLEVDPKYNNNSDPADEYFQQTQKFSSFERTFPSPHHLEVQPEKLNFDKLSNTEEIEENINASGINKLRTSSEVVALPSVLTREKSPPGLKDSVKLSDSLIVQVNEGERPQRNLSDGKDKEELFADSLEASPYRKLHELEHTHPTQEDSEEDEADAIARKPSFYQEQINSVFDKEFRPYSPPFLVNNNGKAENRYSNLDSEEGEEKTMVRKDIEGYKRNSGKKEENEEDKMIDLVYDPVLKCLYDPQTNTYYDIKT